MAFPCGDLLSILEPWVKDINGAAVDMGTWESRVQTLNARESLVRGKASTMLRKFVVYPDGIIYAKGHRSIKEWSGQ